MWTLLTTLACGPKTAEPEVAPEPVEAAVPAAEAAPEVSPSVRLHMSEHFEKTRVANDSFVHGEIAQARASLAWLAEHEAPEGLPEGTRPWLAEMKEAGTAGSAEGPPAQTAAGIAMLGASCGSCHRSSGVVVGQELPAFPEGGDEIHMAQHQWAISALWGGLMGDDAEAWKAGAEALSGEPLGPDAFGVPEVSDSAMAYAQTAHEAARGAVELSDPVDRAEAYATVITACAGCHAEMRGE